MVERFFLAGDRIDTELCRPDQAIDMNPLTEKKTGRSVKVYEFDLPDAARDCDDRVATTVRGDPA
jgi:hypothetical protein